MHLYKTKHDFIHNFLHKSRVVVGRGGFEAKMSSVTLYFKGIQRYAPQTLQGNFYSFNYHQSLFYGAQFNNSFKFPYKVTPVL